MKTFGLRVPLVILITVIIASALAFMFISNLDSGKNAEEEMMDEARIREDVFIQGYPKDAIPPLFNPKYISPEDAVWLDPSDLVLGYEHNGEARAYPILILNWHEIVNDNIGGRAVVVTYCPLCGSGIVFDREVDGRVLLFGNAGSLYESGMVMYDRETESYWWQVGGRAIEGPLKGKTLQHLPSVLSEWGEWLDIYPKTLVLSRDTGYVRNYDSNPSAPFNKKDSPPGYPVSRLDGRLPPKEIVAGISINGEAKAYPLSILGDSVLPDEVGSSRVVVFSKESSSYIAVFDTSIDGISLDFVMDDGKIVDQQTMSIWNTAGVAISGTMKGSRLNQIPSSTEFWFAWAIAHPDTEIGGIT